MRLTIAITQKEREGGEIFNGVELLEEKDIEKNKKLIKKYKKRKEREGIFNGGELLEEKL